MLVERTPNFEFLPIVVVNVGLTLLNNDGMLRYIHVVIKSVDVTSDIVRSHWLWREYMNVRLAWERLILDSM